MCQYRTTTFRCNHTLVLPLGPCHLRPPCDTYHDLIELTNDLGSVCAAIRMSNLNQHHLPGYQTLVGRIRRNFPSWFGHGSANGDRTADSLRQLEAYLEGEIEGLAGADVRVRERSGGFCLDSCWEAMVVMGREEQRRRGHFNGSYGG